MKPIISIFAATFILCACQQSTAKLVPNEYQKWVSPTDKVLNYEIPGHGNRLREIHMNEKALMTVIKDGKADFAEGSIIAKDVYAGPEKKPGENPLNATVMIKAPNDPRSRGGWLWVLRDYKTGSETVITGEFCFTCHADANGVHPYGDQNLQGDFRDYVYYFPGAEKPIEQTQAPEANASSPAPSPSEKSTQPSYGYKY